MLIIFVVKLNEYQNESKARISAKMVNYSTQNQLKGKLKEIESLIELRLQNHDLRDRKVIVSSRNNFVASWAVYQRWYFPNIFDIFLHSILHQMKMILGFHCSSNKPNFPLPFKTIDTSKKVYPRNLREYYFYIQCLRVNTFSEYKY